ncbi:hypothetical protein CAPTEDRAFT_122874 [Capitella teleta]|uniref:Poly [ADP-ribose] polymerase n=1 Tax=Capitella teleta TaxID=283909 RepID=R7V789_CAPTE|nr:hypothetical protein CAPTEDRAFT_122874 [Capitella teleta]|eukprot:ELU14708.1 hypothetical protein CAPTEDRAFT_122874 [Capitella teleta]
MIIISVKTLVVKGKAPVDPECSSKISTAHVYCDGCDVYDAMLNQTNIGHNNNKFYLMQILKDDAKEAYSVWFRWGRVGKVGQNSLTACGSDLDRAKKVFCTKFSDKTKNAWSNRKNFEKIPGKYDLVEIDYGANTKEDEGPVAKKPKNEPESKLDKRLQDLINLICDVKQMEAAVREMKFDARRAPLGKLTVSQIKAGYEALQKVDACITNSTMGHQLTEACSEFYTRIPHDFGMRTPPLIRTKVELKEKIQLLEALSDIQVAMKIIKESNVEENPVDTHYNSLKCKMNPLPKSSQDYKMLEDYLQNTHASTHMQYSMEIEDCYEIEKEGEKEKFVDHGNRKLLWHGSRLTNWVGILSQGLRIAPPEAPVTGYMFGKGVYFADMSSKSANYCFATKTNHQGLLLLSEVSLGKCNELLSADYGAAKLPAGCHSVMGKGKIGPNPKHTFKMPDGLEVPLGKGVDTGVANPSGYTLNYNEFIVYDVSQVKMRYLLKVNFKFK